MALNINITAAWLELLPSLLSYVSLKIKGFWHDWKIHSKVVIDMGEEAF